MERKIYVAIRKKNNDSANPIKMVMERVMSATGQTIVEKAEDADLIIVDSAQDALEMIKEYDANILIALLPMMNQETGARALKRSYPNRIVIGQLFDPKPETDDVPFVPYIIGMMEGKKEERE